MTLKEKFEAALVFTLSRELHNEKCEKIADDYAVEFAEWLMDSHVSELTLKEFKKEKGL